MKNFYKSTSCLNVVKSITKFFLFAVVFGFSFIACKPQITSKGQETVLVDSVILSGSTKVAVGESITLTATILPENATNKNIAWTANKYCTYKDNYDGTVTIYGKTQGSGAVSAMAKDGTGSSDLVEISVLERATVNYFDDKTSLQTINTYFVDDEITQNDYIPTKDGFVFVAWYKDSSLSNIVSYPYTVLSTNNFYAKWNANDTDVTVTYNYNGGTGTPASSTGKAGSTCNLPTPTKDNYDFSGWYLTSDFSGSSVSSPYTFTSNATLYAKWTEQSQTINVTSVSFSDESLSLYVGESATLSYSVLPAKATNKNVIITSSDTDVAYIQNGKVIAKANGSAVITVTTLDGNKTDTLTVSVSTKVSVTGVTVSPTSLELTKGKTGQITATVSPNNATNKNVSWVSGDISVATVSSSGLVTAVSEGSATITCATSDGNKTASCSVSVNAASGLIIHAYDYCNVYIWNTGTSIDKTHTTLTKEGSSNWYTASFDFSFASIIFTKSAGGWTNKTKDLSRTEAGEYWYKNGIWYPYNPDTPATPVVTASVKSGTYLVSQTVTLTGSNSDDIIYYTLDGLTPTTSSSVYDGSLTITTTTTLKVLGYNARAAIQFSDVATFNYVVDANADIEPPVITPSKTVGRYTEAISVSFTISDNKGTTDLRAYYTTDNSTPTTSSTSYTSGSSLSIAMDESKTIRILAVDASGNSVTGSYYYSVGASVTATRFDPRQETIYFLLTSRWFDGDSSNTVGDQWCSSEEDPSWRGDFKGLVEKMDYIKALGFTCIWITPVVQNRGPLCYHGYHAWDMYKEDARLVSDGYDFQRVIDEAHSRGMKICLDVVLQHSSRFGLRDFAEIKYNRDKNSYPVPVGWENFKYNESVYQANNDKYNATPLQTFPNSWQYDGLKSPGRYPTGYMLDGVDVGGQDIPPSADVVGDVRPFNNKDITKYPYLITTKNAGGVSPYQWPTTESYKLTLDGNDDIETGSLTREQYTGYPKLHFHGWANGFNDSGMFDTYPAANLRSIHEDCPDLNTESKEVQDYVIGAYKRYIDMGVDMFRVDTLMHIDKKTVNDVYWPAFFAEAATTNAKNARGGGDFFVFGEVANFVCNFNDKPAELRQSNYTWDNTVTGPDSCSASNNALLDGNTYRTPDYSHKAVPESDYHVSTIDIISHNNFCNGEGGAYSKAIDTSGAYNDATYLTWYTDSHDYGPNKSTTRYQGDFASAWSMLFTFRGIPIVYYGSEIEFAKGNPNDWPGSTKNTINETGRAYYGEKLEGTLTASDFGVYEASGTVASTLSSDLSKHLIALNKIRQAVPALQMGQYSTSGHSGGWAGYKRRYTGTNKITNEAIDSYCLVGVGSGIHSWTGVLNGTYIDCITGNEITASGGNCSFTVSSSGGNSNAALGVYVLKGLTTVAPGKITQDSPYLK